jgi:hypothetical protein
MATTTVHVTTLTKNARNANPTGTTIEAANTHTITPTKRVDQGFLRIVTSYHGVEGAIVVAGDRPPAEPIDHLDIVLADATAADITYLIPLDCSQYIQSDGTIQVTFGGNATGTIEWIELPS